MVLAKKTGTMIDNILQQVLGSGGYYYIRGYINRHVKSEKKRVDDLQMRQACSKLVPVVSMSMSV
jgi:hypothetical protein